MLTLMGLQWLTCTQPPAVRHRQYHKKVTMTMGTWKMGFLKKVCMILWSGVSDSQAPACHLPTEMLCMKQRSV